MGTSIAELTKVLEIHTLERPTIDLLTFIDSILIPVAKNIRQWHGR